MMIRHIVTRDKLFKAIGFIEMLIGISAILGCFIAQTWDITGISPKQLNLYIFVISSATTSFILGVGIFALREWARNLLLFFSGYILITKVLIYMDLLKFNGEILRIIPISFKDTISFIYHAILIIILSKYNQTSEH